MPVFNLMLAVCQVPVFDLNAGKPICLIFMLAVGACVDLYDGSGSGRYLCLIFMMEVAGAYV